MLPAEYDINLSDTHYREILFTIDPNQITNDKVDLSPYEYEVRFETKEEAEEMAQFISGLVGHEIEVEVNAYWGMHGRELVDSFTVQPQQVAGV